MLWLVLFVAAIGLVVRRRLNAIQREQDREWADLTRRLEENPPWINIDGNLMPNLEHGSDSLPKA